MDLGVLNVALNKESRCEVLKQCKYELYLGVKEFPVFIEKGIFMKMNTILKWKQPLKTHIFKVNEINGNITVEFKLHNLRKLVRKNIDHFDHIVLKISYNDETYYIKSEYTRPVNIIDAEICTIKL